MKNKNKHKTKIIADTKLRKSSTSESENQDTNIYLTDKCRDILDGMKYISLTQTTQKLLHLNINNKEKLNILVCQILQKAMNDSKNAEMYAKLCKRLSTNNVNLTGSKNFTFKEALVNYSHRKIKEYFSSKDEDCTGLWQEKMDALFWSASARTSHDQCEDKSNKYGVITFVAHLFIYELLTVKNMNIVIEKLLSVMDSEVWDCLCSLLFLVGEVMESKDQDILVFLKKMREMAKNKNFPLSDHSKEQFKRLIQLRRNKWSKIDSSHSELNLCEKFETVKFAECVKRDVDNDWGLATLNKIVLPRRVIRNQLRQAKEKFNQD